MIGTRTRASWLFAAVVVAGLLAPVSAARAAQCFPAATGVPAQPGPPAWWSGSTSTLVDPRWKGAFSVGYAGDAAQFKALSYTESGTSYALLSFHVKADPSPPAQTDFVFFGFTDGTSKAYAFQLTRTASSTAAEGQTIAPADVAGLTYNFGSSSWSAISTLPGWLTGSNTNVTVVSCGGTPSSCEYAFRVRVPFDPAAANINNGINLPVGGFKFWYEMRAVAATGLSQYKWPETATDAVRGGTPTLFTAAPTPGTATNYKDTNLAGSSCDGGVRLDRQHLVVSYPGSGSDTEISPAQQNTFHVKPINESPGSLARSVLKARVRIADFGSSTLWHDVSPASNCNAAADSGATAVASPAGTFDLTCTWTLSHDEACNYRPDVEPGCPASSTVKKHQCILAELSTTSGSGAVVPFSSQSAYRNMDFGTASWFQRYATVDLASEALPAGPAHDVYLFVKAVNMPLEAKDNPNQPRPRLLDAKGVERVRAEVNAGALTFDAVERLMPTYTVYLWYDTGRTLSEGTTTYRVLAPRPSFGYFLSHEGTPDRWVQKFESDHALTTVLPDYYRLSLERDKSALLWTAIGAINPGDHDPEPSATFPPLASVPCKKFLGFLGACKAPSAAGCGYCTLGGQTSPSSAAALGAIALVGGWGLLRRRARRRR